MYLIKRNGYFHLEYFDQAVGKIRRVSTRTKIKSLALQFLNEFSNKNIEINLRNTEISLIVFRERYLSYCKINFSSKYIISIESSFKRLLQFVGDVCLLKLRRIDIENFLLSTYKDAPYSARQYHRTLKAAFNKAISWGFLSDNPFVGIKLPKPKKNLPIFITQEQFNYLINFEKDEQLQRLYILAFNTGLRLGEIANLLWISIDYNEKLLYVRNTDDFITKSKIERAVPLNKKAYNTILDQKLYKKRITDYVFSNAIGKRLLTDYISKRFKKCLRSAGLDERIHFHSLRHSFASNLAQRGVSLFQIKNLLGHSSITTTEIYSHINNQSLREAVEKL